MIRPFNVRREDHYPGLTSRYNRLSALLRLHIANLGTPRLRPALLSLPQVSFGVANDLFLFSDWTDARSPMG